MDFIMRIMDMYEKAVAIVRKHYYRVLRNTKRILERTAKTMGSKRKKSERFFDNIADEYDNMELSENTGILFDYFVSRIREQKMCAVLDVGCGTGRLIEILSGIIPDAQMWGLDISQRMIEKAREKGIPNAEFIKGDSESIPLESDSCDVICCNHSFHHYPNPFRTLREFRRVLKPGGMLMIGENSFPEEERRRKNLRYLFYEQLGDVWIYSEKEICFLLSRYFGDVQYIRVQNRYCFVTARKKFR